MIALLLLSLGLAGCTGTSALNPAGPRATQIASLWWLMFVLGTATFVLVVVLLLYALYRRRRTVHDAADERHTDDDRRSNRWIILGGIIFPAIVLTIVYGYTVYSLGVLSGPGDADGEVIEVIGHQWWWEVRYPEHDIITANEIHIPVGQRVQLRLSSTDVIHSLWVPRLMGKLDLIPGKVNTMWVSADEAGEYLGECAEFCGTQHAKMRLLVIAEETDDFLAWTENESSPAATPANEQLLAGQQVFLGSACVYCHRIAGTNATGNVGPDLTHIGSRRTLGAGIMPNVPGNLAGWIVNSQALKPGNRMPPMYLEAEDLEALLAYLASLQ